MAALYPAMELMELSASIDCARAMRGTASMLKLTTPRPARSRAASGW